MHFKLDHEVQPVCWYCITCFSAAAFLLGFVLAAILFHK